MPSQTGKVDPHHPKVSGHRGNVLDIKWNPFDDFCIASCSEDATVSVNHLRFRLVHVHGLLTKTDLVFTFLQLIMCAHVCWSGKDLGYSWTWCSEEHHSALEGAAGSFTTSRSDRVASNCQQHHFQYRLWLPGN